MQNMYNAASDAQDGGPSFDDSDPMNIETINIGQGEDVDYTNLVDRLTGVDEDEEGEAELWEDYTVINIWNIQVSSQKFLSNKYAFERARKWWIYILFYH